MPTIASTLATTLLVILVYFWVVRLIDMNEKEPLWAMTLLFVLGATAAVVLRMVASPAILDLTVLPAAALEELARFGAIGAGIYALTVYGRLRGWQEFNGTMDGVVYGACAGLGFATALEVRSELLIGAVPLPGASMGLFAGFGKIALRGLADGVFGAVIGAGIGAATEARSPLARALLPLAGASAAVLAHVGYFTLAHGNALGGMNGLVRSYVALALPVLAVALTVVFALRSERGAIRRQLAAEVDSGVMSAEEFSLLQHVLARSASTWKHAMRGQFKTWNGLRLLYNRQVQLALVKEKASKVTDPAVRAELDRDIARLRDNVLACKRAVSPAHAEGSREVQS